MKNILITLVIVLSAAGVRAQLGEPKELTCTEEAFNFSFALGANWKLSTPRMGPVGVIKDEPDYNSANSANSALALSVYNMSPKTDAYSSVAMPFNFEALQYANHQQNYASRIVGHRGFSLMNKPAYLLPAGIFNPAINYTVSTPNFTTNSTPAALWVPVQTQ